MVQSEYIYLHGFASSPQSNKAQYLRECFQSLQINLTIPDLNQGYFFGLTLTRQLQFLQAEYLENSKKFDIDQKASQHITSIGSSFGGLTATILAQHNLQVKRLVLLAPAFHFSVHLSNFLGAEQMQKWQTDGSLLFPHYGQKCAVPLDYNFWTDLVQYQDEKFSREIPTLILHGRDDDTIPIQSSQEFASQRPWVELRKLDSDHSLGNVMGEIWETIQEFCQI